MTAPATSVAIVDESPLLRMVDGSRARIVTEVRSPVVEDFILDELAAGVTLAKICRTLGINRTTVYNWRDDDPDFAKRFLRAREIGWDAIADDTMVIADNVEEDAKSRKIRIEARQKLLASWASGSYANSLKVESFNKSLVVELSSDPVEAARQYQELMGS